MTGLLDWWNGEEVSPITGGPLYVPPEVRTAGPDYVAPMRSMADVQAQMPRDLAGGTLGGRTVMGFTEGPAAVKPLPMDAASRAARAQQLGYNTPAYHGTNSDIAEFNRIDGGNMWGRGHYFTSSPEDASKYATGWHNRMTPEGNAGPNVMPVLLRAEKPWVLEAPAAPKDMKAAMKMGGADFRTVARDDARRGRRWTNQDLEEALGNYADLGGRGREPINQLIRSWGYDAIQGASARSPAGGQGTITMMFDPSGIRSRHAAFDPAMRGSANILAGGAAGGVGLGLGLLDEDGR